MPASWSLACCVLLAVLIVCCAIHPQQQHQQKHQQQQQQPTPQTLEQNRVKRNTDECPVIETEESSGLQKIVDSRYKSQKFFIQPQPGFRRLVFRAKVNNKFDISSWSYADEALEISSSRLTIDWTHPTWIPVDVQYFKNEKNWGRDRHSLSIKVGEDVNEELITKWWWTHSYEGFAVYAEGPLKVILKCNPYTATAESLKDVKEESRILVIVGVVGACFLLVMIGGIVYLRGSRDNHPSVPGSPKVMPHQRCIKQEEDNDPIYETIDEAKLDKIHQKLKSDTLCRPHGEKDHCGASNKGSKENTMPLYEVPLRAHLHSPGIPAGVTEGALGLSLLEEKAALREYSGLDSPLENHYVEMHGIVSRTSSLNK